VGQGDARALLVQGPLGLQQVVRQAPGLPQEQPPRARVCPLDRQV